MNNITIQFNKYSKYVNSALINDFIHEFGSYTLRNAMTRYILAPIRIIHCNNSIEGLATRNSVYINNINISMNAV